MEAQRNQQVTGRSNLRRALPLRCHRSIGERGWRTSRWTSSAHQGFIERRTWSPQRWVKLPPKAQFTTAHALVQGTIRDEALRLLLKSLLCKPKPAFSVCPNHHPCKMSIYLSNLKRDTGVKACPLKCKHVFQGNHHAFVMGDTAFQNWGSMLV